MAASSAQAVIHEIATRKPEDFAQLVRNHQAMVFSIGYSFLGDRAVAEEIAQDVFLELFRRQPLLESPGHVINWLRRVAMHRSIDAGRRRKICPQVPLQDVREPAAPPVGGDLLMSGRLRQLVRTLPEKARMVVILRYQEDLELAEIAEALEMPLSTVKSHLTRSLALLREKLARSQGGRP